MNILQIANKAIAPPDGGSLAILSLTKGYLTNDNNVHLLNIETHKHKNYPIPKELKNNSQFKLTGVNINIKIKLFSLLLNYVFSKKPYIAQRFVSKIFTSKLLQILKKAEFDIIQFEGLYSLQYIKFVRHIFKGKIIYRPHNIEYDIWFKNAYESKFFIKKLYFKNTAKRLKKLEKKLLNTYDYIIPIADGDKNIFSELGNIKPCKVIPFGIDLKTISNPYSNKEIPKSLCYIGALDWLPNQKGILWFIEHVLPLIKINNPDIEIKVAGRNAPKWLINKLNNENIVFCGQVDNAQDFLRSNGPMIIPLFSGSGMRVKIIEAMALQKTIIATKQAAEGISFTNNKNIFISNTKEEFAECIIELIRNQQLQKKVGLNAFNLIKDKYNNATLAKELINFIN